MLSEELLKRQGTGELNDGFIPTTVFNAADQFVDVGPGSGHEFVAPGPNDKRGPCPGLNAAANHNFIPHNGILNSQQTISGLLAAYSFGVDISTFLAAISIALTGDPFGGTWSIGGPYPPSTLGALAGVKPSGLSYSHNRYEGDASPTRMDAFLNNGDAFDLNLDRFKVLYNAAQTYNLDITRAHNKYVHNYSVQNNPYFFNANFGGVTAGLITHILIVTMFSNHSSTNINGFLERNILKSFYGISGPDDALVYTPGNEQIPLNWYKRSSTNTFGFPAGGPDIAVSIQQYPEFGSIGGNTGTVSSLTGVNVGDLTGGAFSAQSLLQGNNFGCFMFQAAQQLAVSSLSGLLGSVISSLTSTINSAVLPYTQAFNCPALTTFNQSALSQFPGASYSPAVPPASK